jgi:ribosomal protein S18 acetylase RimI-like enzyme
VNVRPATLADLVEVLAILSDAGRRAPAAAVEQWPDPFPAERVLPALERGDTYLVDLAGQPAATLTLQWEDPDYWGARPPDAGYLHRLAVRPAYAAQGVGGRLLGWLNAQIAERGRDYLRLSCMTANPGLRRYYEAAGFEHRGDIVVRGRSSSRYERRVRDAMLQP